MGLYCLVILRWLLSGVGFALIWLGVVDFGVCFILGSFGCVGVVWVLWTVVVLLLCACVCGLLVLWFGFALRVFCNLFHGLGLVSVWFWLRWCVVAFIIV